MSADNKNYFVMEEMDIKFFINRFLDYKYIFIFITFVFLVVAYLKNKFAVTVYQNTTTIKVIDNSVEGAYMNATSFLSERNVAKQFTNVRNELDALKSFSLINKTLTELNFEVSYYHEQNVFFEKTTRGSSLNKSIELYKEMPVRVLLDKSHPQVIDVPFYITYINDSTFKIEAQTNRATLYNYIDGVPIGSSSAINFNKTVKTNETVETPNFRFKLLQVPNSRNASMKGKIIYFSCNHLDYLTVTYLSLLTPSLPNETATTINISLKGKNPDRIIEFLNKLVSLYLDQKLNKKNDFADKTINFIEAQLTEISDSLNLAKQRLQYFRSSNQVLDLGFQGQQLFSKISELEAEKASVRNQIAFYTQLLDNIKTNPNVGELSTPSTMNIIDPLLNSLISDFVNLNNQRSSLLGTNSKSLYLKDLETKMNNVKNSIFENVTNSLSTLNNSQKELEYRISKFNAEASNLPKTQLNLLGIERNFKINDANLTFLLQKRAEAEITRNSNSPDCELIDPARPITNSIAGPKKNLNYIIALLMGVFLPFIVIIGRDYLNDKIIDRTELENVSKRNLIGQIYRNYHKSGNILVEKPMSSVSESFRTLRTNLQILSKENRKQCICVTSSVSGEGKSFISYNLAVAFANLGKRTIILEFDLRKPALSPYFNNKNTIGLSTYLSGRAVLEDIVIQSETEGLSFIPSGPVPPNPIELMSTETTRKLLLKLHELYDYIIIDSAPIGIVADAYFVMNLSNISLLVARYNYTPKIAFKNTIKYLNDNDLKNIYLTFNCVELNSRKYGYYHYSKYYISETHKWYKPNLRKKIKSLFS